jgi:hypothetical protein
LSAGTQAGALARRDAAVVLAVAIALGFADAGARAATMTRQEVTQRYGVRAVPSVPVRRTQALNHELDTRRNGTERARTALALPALRGTSSLSRSENGRTWLIAAALIAAMGASFAGVARLLRGIRRRRRLAAAAGNTTAARGAPPPSRPGQRDPGAARRWLRAAVATRAGGVAAPGGRAGHRIRDRVE